MFTFTHIILLILLYCTSNSIAQSGKEVPELAAVDSTLLSIMKRWEVPGISIAISKDSRLVYARGFGYADIENDIVMQPYHRCRIASISKPITATAIFMLIEDGLLSLDDKVFGEGGLITSDKFDPADPGVTDKRILDITVRHLLDHSCGWNSRTSSYPLFNDLHKVASVYDVISPPLPDYLIKWMLFKYPLKFDPGEGYGYSNFGFYLLGRIIEKVAGMRYEYFVDRNIFRLIDADSFMIGKTLRENQVEDEVVYYTYPGRPLSVSVFDKSKRVPIQYGGYHVYTLGSAAGWIASSLDLLKFALSMDGSGIIPDLLPESTIQLMTTPSKNADYRGLGWRLYSEAGAYGHAGSLPGSLSRIRIFDNGICYSLLINYRPANGTALSTAIREALDDVLESIGIWPEHDLFNIAVSVEEEPQFASEYILHQNYPNPFNPETKIAFTLQKPGVVRLTVYDVRGRAVKQLVRDRLTARTHEVTWDGASEAGIRVASGIYFYTLTVDGIKRFSRKMVLLK